MGEPAAVRRACVERVRARGDPRVQVNVKTPTNQKVSDSSLPLYPHETDLAVARDLAVLWRALDTRTPQHACYTEADVRAAVPGCLRAWLPACLTHRLGPSPQAQFNVDAPYLADEALKQELRGLRTFDDFKAWLVRVLPPPPDWRPPCTKARKRKSSYLAAGATFEKLLTSDNLKGYGKGRLFITGTCTVRHDHARSRTFATVTHVPTPAALPRRRADKAMNGEPFHWVPPDPQNPAQPPVLLLSCSERGVEGMSASLCRRTRDGYLLGVSRCPVAPLPLLSPLAGLTPPPLPFAAEQHADASVPAERSAGGHGTAARHRAVGGRQHHLRRADAEAAVLLLLCGRQRGNCSRASHPSRGARRAVGVQVGHRRRWVDGFGGQQYRPYHSHVGPPGFSHACR